MRQLTPPIRLPGSRLALVAALALVAVALGVPVAAEGAPAWSSESFSPDSERHLVALTNTSRIGAGLAELPVDPALTDVARWRSRDMVDRGYFSHRIPPADGSVFDELQRRGYCFALAGENIGWNTYPDAVATRRIHEMLLASPGHRRNILGAGWDAVGIGAFKGASGSKTWTVLFADRCG